MIEGGIKLWEELKELPVQPVNASFQVIRNERDDALAAAAPSPGQLWLTCTQVFGVYLLAAIGTTSEWFILPSHIEIDAPHKRDMGLQEQSKKLSDRLKYGHSCWGFMALEGGQFFEWLDWHCPLKKKINLFYGHWRNSPLHSLRENCLHLFIATLKAGRERGNLYSPDEQITLGTPQGGTEQGEFSKLGAVCSSSLCALSLEIPCEGKPNGLGEGRGRWEATFQHAGQSAVLGSCLFCLCLELVLTWYYWSQLAQSKTSNWFLLHRFGYLGRDFALFCYAFNGVTPATY